MALDTQNGFARRPYAIRKLVKGADGTLQVIYVDQKTGQQIDNPEGYKIVDANAGKYWDGNKNNNNSGNGNNSDTGPKQDKTSFTNAVMGQRGERPDIAGAVTKNTEPSYINKPAAMGFAGFLPGILGTAGMMANLGVNANNTAAVNDKRESLGFSERSTMSNVGSTLMDKQGYIGDASYANAAGKTQTTPVSFESQDSAGRTTLTPNEARMRAETNPTFREATLAETQNAQQSFQQEFGSKGFLSGLSTAAKGMFSSMFSTPSPTGGTGGTSSTTSGGFNQGTKSFPDAPTPPTQNTPSNTPGGIGGGLRDSNTGLNPGGVGLY